MEFVKKLKVASTISQQGGTITTGGSGGTATTGKVHPYDFFDFQIIPDGPVTEEDRNHYAELLGCAAEQFQICQDLLLHEPTVKNVQLTEITVKNIFITLWQNLPQIIAADKRGVLV